MIAVISMVTYLPWLLVSLPAGALADRYDRATLMWRAQLVQCAGVASGAGDRPGPPSRRRGAGEVGDT